MAEAIVLTVVGRLTDLLTDEAQLLDVVSDQIQQVVTELRRMMTFLRHADSRTNEERVRILIAQVRDLVYDAENIVECFLLKAFSCERHRTQGGIQNIVKRHVCVLHDNVCHYKFLKEMKQIRRRMQNLFKSFSDYHFTSTLEGGLSALSETVPSKLERFYLHPVVEPELFVGFEGEVEILVDHLVNASDDCYPVVFVCGMGGLGKTTLATKIYHHSTIKSYFAGLAWVCISRVWQPKDVLQRILVSLVPENENKILKFEVDELVENLLEIQQRKNCLIVLDDIWSNDAWDSLKAAFATTTSKSKLLLTSRNIDVADHVNPKCFIHKPQVLNAEQSWELLRLNAFPKQGYLGTRDAKKMEEWGREMVQNCAGLPLAIVVLGGILVTKPTFIEWEKVYYDSLSSLKRGKGLGEDHQSEVFDILVWSYNVLPTQLKLCFLYLGKFGEDEEIETETLYQLWIAEGMVLSSDKSEGETMMEVAEFYMGELVQKSMVQVKFEDDEGSQRKFKSCLLHDLMRDLSLSIAKENDFFKVVNLQRVDDSHLDSSVELAASYTRQLVVYFDTDVYTSIRHKFFLVKKASQRRIRSVLLFDQERDRSLPPILGSHVSNFRFLRVFALEGVGFYRQIVTTYLFNFNLGKVLGSLVHLRYLSLRNTDLFVFPTIQKLELLQTLRLDTVCTYQRRLHFPPWMSKNILKNFQQLQHLYLPSEVGNLMNRTKLRFDGLTKLETLENFDTRYFEVKDLAKLTNLQKLSLHVVDGYDDLEEIIKYLKAMVSSSPSSSGSTTSCVRYLSLEISYNFFKSWNPIPQIRPDILRQLLSDPLNLHKLTIWGEIPELVPLFDIDHLFSSSITTLYLHLSDLGKDPMPVLEKLPMLRNLQLYRNSFAGKKMVCSATGFPQLIHLKLENLFSLKKWSVEEGGIPNLSLLSIVYCRELVELPEGLKFLNNLREVTISHMPTDFYERLHLANGEQGPDFYKVSNVPSLVLQR